MSDITVHASWLSDLRRLLRKKGTMILAQNQKTFRIMDPTGQEESVHAVDITIVDNSGTAGAEQTGWVVDVRYKNAPDQVVFTATQPTEQQARDVMSDLSTVAAEIEGLIRQEDFEGARERTNEFLKKMKANSGEPHVEEQEE